MATERVTFDPARPETGCLSGLTTVAPTGKFIEVTPNSFPWLFRGQPDLLEEYRSKGLSRLHTFHYATRPLNLADLLKLPHWKVDPAELAYHQTLTSYPGVVIKTVDWTNGPKTFGQHPVSSQSKPGQNFVAAHFTKAEKAIDYTSGHSAPPSVGDWVIDAAVNTYFAFHLIKLSEFSNPDQLIEYTQQRDIPLDLTLLQAGFTSLVAKKTIRQLTGHQLAPTPVEDFYGSAANWLKMLALQQVTLARISRTIISPYPISIRREQVPPIGFIPHIAQAWYDFLLDLPLYIAEGGQYPLFDLLSAVENLQSLMENIIRVNIRDELGLGEDYQLEQLLRLVKQHRMQMKEEIVRVNNQLKVLDPAFGRILGIFKRFPHYLNGTSPNHDSKPLLPDYLQFRQEILASRLHTP